MSSIKITLEFDNYNEDDELCFRRKGGGWLDMYDLKQRVGDALDKAEDLMRSGDSLIITIHAQSQEEKTA